METVVTHFYSNADASHQKGVNFRAIMNRVLIGSFDITPKVGGTARTMDCGQGLYFSLPLVSRSARNIAFTPLGSISTCHAG